MVFLVVFFITFHQRSLPKGVDEGKTIFGGITLFVVCFLLEPKLCDFNQYKCNTNAGNSAREDALILLNKQHSAVEKTHLLMCDNYYF